MNLYKRCRCSAPTKCRHPFWFRFRLHGDECRRSTKSANRNQAQRIAAVRQAAVLEGREGLRRAGGVKLSVHIKEYLAHTAKKNRTSGKDADVLARVLASIGDRRLREVSSFALERWKAARAKHVSQSTVNRELNIVRGCFARGVEWDRIARSPVRSVKPYRVDNIRLRILTDAETSRLLSEEATAEAFAAAAAKKKAIKLSPALVPDLRLMARTTLCTLLRLSEVLALRRQDIGATEIVVVNSKSGLGRKVPLPAELRAALLGRCHASGWVFGRGETGAPPTAATVSVAFTRWMTHLKLAGVSHHVCRHTGASNMLRDGASLRAVQQIGGWTSLRMLERYAHVTDEELHRAVRLASTHTAGTNTGTAANPAAEASGQ